MPASVCLMSKLIKAQLDTHLTISGNRLDNQHPDTCTYHDSHRRLRQHKKTLAHTINEVPSYPFPNSGRAPKLFLSQIVVQVTIMKSYTEKKKEGNCGKCTNKYLFCKQIKFKITLNDKRASPYDTKSDKWTKGDTEQTQKKASTKEAKTQERQ